MAQEGGADEVVQKDPHEFSVGIVNLNKVAAFRTASHIVEVFAVVSCF